MSGPSGSTRRQRTEILTARVNPQEKELALEKAKAYGGVSALFRVAVLNARPRPSLVDQAAFAQALAALGKLASELNKIGSNLNQLTHYANLGRPLEASIRATLAELEGPIDREFWEMRAQLMRALGLEQSRKPGD